MKSKQLLGCLAAVAALAASSAPAWALVSGALFTTDKSCGDVNSNIYCSKDDVYIRSGTSGGGNSGPAGLSDGSYYVRVSDPSTSKLLGESAPLTVQVLNGNFVGPGGATCLQLSATVHKPGITDLGFLDSDNPGGVYKVSVSTVTTFDPSATKYDVFKVACTKKCVNSECGGGGSQGCTLSITGPADSSVCADLTSCLGTITKGSLTSATVGIGTDVLNSQNLVVDWQVDGVTILTSSGEFPLGPHIFRLIATYTPDPINDPTTTCSDEWDYNVNVTDCPVAQCNSCGTFITDLSPGGDANVCIKVQTCDAAFDPMTQLSFVTSTGEVPTYVGTCDAGTGFKGFLFLFPADLNGTTYTVSASSGNYSQTTASQCTLTFKRCPLTQGYWKTHSISTWPVQSLVIGNCTYTASALQAILNTSVGSGTSADASLILADQLIAAMLNVANGAIPCNLSLVEGNPIDPCNTGCPVTTPIDIANCLLSQSDSSALYGNNTCLPYSKTTTTTVKGKTQKTTSRIIVPTSSTLGAKMVCVAQILDTCNNYCHNNSGSACPTP